MHYDILISNEDKCYLEEYYNVNTYFLQDMILLFVILVYFYSLLSFK